MSEIDDLIAKARGAPVGVDDLIAKARSKPPEASKELGPMERAMLSYGTGAWEGIRKAANWSFGMPSAPAAIQDPAVKEGADKLRKLTEGHFWTGEVPAFVGEMVGPTVATAPLGAPAAVSKVSPLLRLLTRAGSGAAQGAVGSGMMGADEGLGAGVGTAFGVAGPAVGGYLKRGGERASESAVKLMAEGRSAFNEIVDKFMKPGMTSEQALQSAGSALRQVRGAGGQRLVSPMKPGAREAILAEYGDAAGEKINAIMREADRRGLTGNPQEVLANLRAARDEVLGTGPGSRLTNEQLAAREAADTHINRFMNEFRTRAVPGDEILGVVPEETAPFALNKRDPSGKIIGQEQVLSKDVPGVNPPESQRVFAPAEDVGVSQGHTPKGQFTKGEPNPQPNLQESAVVTTPTSEMGLDEALNVSGAARPVNEGAHLPPRLRNWLERNGVDTAEAIPKDVLENGNIRRAILGSKELSAQQKRLLLTNGSVRDPEIEALRRSRFRQEQMVTKPESIEPVGQEVSFQDLPLSEFEEGAKRAYQDAAYLRKSSGAYRTDKAASADPFNRWLRRAGGVLKGQTEERLSPDLLPGFLAEKSKSQLASTFKDLAHDVSISGMAHDPVTGGSLHGTMYRMLVRDPMMALRPYLVAGNEGLEKLGNRLPEGTQEALMNAVIDMLRQKESR